MDFSLQVKGSSQIFFGLKQRFFVRKKMTEKNNNGWKIYALSDITFSVKSSHQRLSHARPTQIRGQGIPCSGSLKQRTSSLTP